MGESISWRRALDADLTALAELNAQLVEDEGHQNPMGVDDLAQRLRRWLNAGYEAVVFSADSRPIAYALYRAADDGWEGESGGIYLRQFFVCRDRRRRGVGRRAMDLLRDEVWPRRCRVTLEASMGFVESITRRCNVAQPGNCDSVSSDSL